MNTATRIALCQLVIAVLAAVAWGALEGGRSAAAAFSGGLISAALTYYAGAKTFGLSAADPRLALMGFFRAQARKWVLAIVLFTVAARVFGNDFVPLIATFAAALTVYWFALLWKS